MLTWPKKNVPTFGMGRGKEEEREVSPEGRTDLYQVKEEERIGMCLGIILLYVEQKMERSVRIDHEGPQMPG